MSEFNELDVLNSKGKKEGLSKSDLKKRIKELEGMNKSLKEENERLIYNNRFILEENEKLKLEVKNFKNEILKANNNKKDIETYSLYKDKYYIVEHNTYNDLYIYRGVYVLKYDFDNADINIIYNNLYYVRSDSNYMFSNGEPSKINWSWKKVDDKTIAIDQMSIKGYAIVSTFDGSGRYKNYKIKTKIVKVLK